MAAKSEALVPWAQGVAGREVERLQREGPKEGKRVHELPPEVLLQKDERKQQAPLPKAGRMLELPPQKSRRKRDTLPPEGKCELDALPQGSPNKGNHRGGCEPLRQRRRDVDAPTLGDYRLSIIGCNEIRNHDIDG